MLFSSLLLGVAVASQHDVKPVELTMHESVSSLTLTFEIERGVMGKFLVDSGSRLSYISPDFAKRRKSVDLRFGLFVGDRTIAMIEPHVEAVPARLQEAIDGVLGCDFLSQVVLGVDPRSAKATLWPSGTKESTLRTWIIKKASSARFRSEIPLTLRGGLPTLPLRLSGKEIVALLDTGTSTTVLSKDSLPLVPHFRLRKVQVSLWDGPRPASLVLISGYGVGGVESRFPSVLIPEESTGDEAILGFDALSQGPWTLDLGRQRLRLGEYAAGLGSRFPQISGVDFVQTNEGLAIKVGLGLGLPPDKYKVVSVNGWNAEEALSLLSEARITRLSMQEEVARRGAFLLSMIDDGLTVVVDVGGGKTSSLRIGSPRPPIPPPPGVAKPGYVWKFDRLKGWIQIKLSDLSLPDFDEHVAKGPPTPGPGKER